MPLPINIYLNAAACISPYAPEQAPGTAHPLPYPRLRCIEPDYKEFIDPRLIRRMSRVVKMGTAAALACLREAGLDLPGAILTGTAYGCTEDTEQFLQKLVAQNEEMLTPTAFIQSTHNTIGSQIALLLQCHAYNNTFVHRAFSFEHALLDAMLLLRENEAPNALVGGVDEMADIPYELLSRFDLYKKIAPAEASVPAVLPEGTIAGEGAAFFLLSPEKLPGAGVRLLDVATFYKPENMPERVAAFLHENGLSAGDIDLLLWGKNGDSRYDGLYDGVAGGLFPATLKAGFKPLCGEYPTATAFATWLAVQVISGKNIPAGLLPEAGFLPKKILIYNHFYNIHHSLILLGAC